MKPQLTLQTPLELPHQEISNYLNQLWISEDEDLHCIWVDLFHLDVHCYVYSLQGMSRTQVLTESVSLFCFRHCIRVCVCLSSFCISLSVPVSLFLSLCLSLRMCLCFTCPPVIGRQLSSHRW